MQPIMTEEKELLVLNMDNCESLPIESFFDWFTAIINNDIEYVAARLESSSEMERQHLLNGTFDYNEDTGDKLKEIQGHGLKICRPICLAAAFGANQVFKEFVRFGANVAVVDNNGYNVLHCIIAFSVFEPHKETENVVTYKMLVNELNSGIIKDLLYQENDEKLRPVEMAAQCGTFTLLGCIFETEGVYVSKVEKRGIYNYRWIDITEYETYSEGNRRSKSPVLFLTLLHQRDLKRQSTENIFKKPLVVKWMNGKFHCSKPGVFAWALLRLVFVVVYYLQDSINLHSLPSDEDHKVSNSFNDTTPINTPGPRVAGQSDQTLFHLDYCKFYMYFFIPENVIHGLIVYLLVHSAGKAKKLH